MASSGMLHRVALVRTDVSEELSTSSVRVTRIGEIGTLAVISNRRTLCAWYANIEMKLLTFKFFISFSSYKYKII
jgi:hypothetical protein